ncbi:MAG: hypothetical protein AAF357_18540, partial [Verrucomicrobiota bacterium]
MIHPVMVFRLLLISVFLHASSSKTLASSEELETLKQQFTEVRSETIDKPFGEQLLILVQNYDNVLDRAIQSAQNRGDIDSIVELKGENLRVSNGSPLEDAYSSAELNTLASTFETHRQSILTVEVKKRHEIALKLSDSLTRMEVVLTKGNRIDDAIEVRRFRESDGFFDLIVGEVESINSSKVRKAIIASFHPEALKPDRDGSSPSNSRIVIVAEDDDDALLSPPDTFAKIQSDDRKDIVFLGKTTPPVLGMICNQGNLIQYLSGDDNPTVIEADATFCAQYPG